MSHYRPDNTKGKGPRVKSTAFPHASPIHEYEHSADELEFIKAIDRYKCEHNRMFPTWGEALAVLKGLGYRKGMPLPPVNPLE